MSRADRRRQANAGKSSGAEASSAKPLLIALTVFLVIAIAVVAVLAVSSGSGGASSGSFTPNNEGLIQPGNQAPQAQAESVDGGQVSVPADGPTLLVFFATWCPHCNNEAPLISDLSKEYENLNVVMAGIDGEDNPGKVREFVEEYDIEGEAFYEPSIGQTYQVSGYPTTYVIGGSGEIVGANTGETPENVLRDWVEQATS